MNEQKNCNPNEKGSGRISKQTLLQQVRGSMTHLEVLTEENFERVAEAGVTYSQIKELFEAAGLDAGKIIVDPEREIFNCYYADFERGLYFEVFLQPSYLEAKSNSPSAYKRMREEQNFLVMKDWHSFYHIAVPTPLRVYDFQKRYKAIEPEKVFEVWAYIHQNLDYANDQWKPEVLEYVFGHAPKPENLPLNENGKVTVFRGCGTISQSPDKAMSWSSNCTSALWFANHNGLGQAVYTGEVAPENVKAYFGSFRDEFEVVVKPGTVENVRKLDMVPVTKDSMVRLLAPVVMDLKKYGKVAMDLYRSESMFGFHGRKHILRVLTLALILFHNSRQYDLYERDKKVLIYFALLHDCGRTNEEVDDDHGRKSVERIYREGITVPDLKLPNNWASVAQTIIRHHCSPDFVGQMAIAELKRLSTKDRTRALYLYDICKDADGLDRVRFNGLDVSQLRTDFGKRLPLVAGALLHENIEAFIEMKDNDGKETEE